jgi:lipoprotein-anchoring transpeptidase ErfK/SrfK
VDGDEHHTGGGRDMVRRGPHFRAPDHPAARRGDAHQRPAPVVAGDLAGRVIPPGPENPLKARWMGFNGGAGIHGTNDVGSLGNRASHGCVRMAIPDVKQLYAKVDVGTPVYIL